MLWGRTKIPAWKTNHNYYLQATNRTLGNLHPSKVSKYLITHGDININNLEKNDKLQILNDIFESFTLINHCNGPTRL